MRALLLLLVLLAGPAAARTLLVGQSHPTLAAAARAAGDGDTIQLPAGEFFDCAVITARDVVLQGAGAATVITDAACEGKALVIARGGNFTLRDLVLARARVPDQNGAGIRLEAQGLVVERVRFDNDQVGILAGSGGPGRIRITDCVFIRGGVAGGRPTSAVMVGPVALLQIERSVFEDVRGGQVSTAADRSELTGNRIATGIEPGAGHAVLAPAGHLVMRGNELKVGPNAPPRDAAVAAAGGGVELHGNRLVNTAGRPLTLLLDWTRGASVREANVVGPGDAVSSSSGLWRSRAGGLVRDAANEARGAAGAARRAVRGLFGP